MNDKPAKKKTYKGLPKNNPQEFLDSGRVGSAKATVVCAGDSLTHGQISSDYVALLRDSFAAKGYDFMNAGINGDMSANLLQRIDQIIACGPDAVLILIGSNDINATLNEKTEATYRKSKQLTVKPTLEWSSSNIEKILTALQAAGIGNIAIFSIPMLGEDLDSALNRRARQYNSRLRELAEKYGVTYLPLYEELVAGLPANHHPKGYEGKMRPILAAALKRLLLKQSWQRISDSQGLYYLTDFIHLNERATAIIKRLAENYLAKLDL